MGKKKQEKIDLDLGSNGSGGREQSLPAVLLRRSLQASDSGQSASKPSGPMTWEEYNAQAELLRADVSDKDLDARTEVNSLQILNMSRGRIIAKRFGSRYLDEFITNIMRLSLSKNRKSRKEHVQALQSSMMGDGERTAVGIMDRLR